ADAWIVSDPLAPADAVAVFGGGLKERPAAAAAYYHQGLVAKILVSNVRKSADGSLPSHTAANEAALMALGVPADAIETFGADLSSTHDEVRALSRWAEEHHARSIIVPTEIFSTRRVRWTLHRAISDRVAIRVIALEDRSSFGRDDWWRSPDGILSF